MQSSICGGAEGLGHAQPSHDFLEAHDMFWFGECGVEGVSLELCSWVQGPFCICIIDVPGW